MLRGTRPILASSSRAIVSPKAPISTLRRCPFRAADVAGASRPGEPSRQLLPRTRRIRYATKPPPRMQSERDPEEEKKFGRQKLESNPEAVSTASSVRHFYEPDDAETAAEKPVSDGIEHDLNIVKDTFRLRTVPKESYVLGLAGTIPYFATSLSTLYLSWDLNTEWPSQSQLVNSLLVDHESARHWLGVLEPLQLGYGAVIVSFLGAVHWGLEYAEKAPSRARTRFRYGLGVLAPVAAWPTLLMPVEFALTCQFGAFVALYWADTYATRRGWAPVWYGTYRFVLTAITGAAIALSLIGRAKVGDAKPRLSGLGDKFREKKQGEEAYDEKWEKLESEEKEKIKEEKEEEEKKKKEKQEKKKNEEGKKGSKEKGSQEKKGDEEKGDKEEKSKNDEGQQNEADEKGDEKEGGGEKKDGKDEKK